MNIEADTLKQIANSVISKLKSVSEDELKDILQINDYHGFLKSRISESFLMEVFSPSQLTSRDVQIEIVKVETDLSKEIHFHENSYAYVICLGKEHNLEDPRNAKAFLKNSWFPVRVGDVIKIPPKTLHGFTVENGGILTFLSVQAPPIEQFGIDDYHKIDI